jgi:hypothetical protein
MNIALITWVLLGFLVLIDLEDLGVAGKKKPAKCCPRKRPKKLCCPKVRMGIRNVLCTNEMMVMCST